MKIFFCYVCDMAEKRITVDQAKAFNAAVQELLTVAEDAVARVEASGSSDFVCSNYRQAVLGASFIAKYVRDFAGSSATAAIEDRVQAILDSVTPPKLKAVADDVSAYKKKRAKSKKKSGNSPDSE